MKLTPVSAAVLSVLAASQVHAKSDVFYGRGCGDGESD